MSQIVKCHSLKGELSKILSEIDYDRLFILTDEHTNKLCLPFLKETGLIDQSEIFIIKAGDDNKNIESLSSVWEFLSNNKATRKSLMINLGGGMLTDLGGFAAATFKRGLRFINIPTTLLGAVDAAVGGKTGINFNGLKNEIGAFTPAEYVLIDTGFFRTLDRRNLLSGYAEVIKHALLDTKEGWLRTLQFDIEDVDYDQLADILFHSVQIKERIVKEDPTEKGIRKALNLGHTFGHAFESISYEMGRPAPHGYAVAWGIVCELYLSYRQLRFDQNEMLQTIHYIKEHYGSFYFDCRQYQRLYELMKHDKKNESDLINFTLLENIGRIQINCTASMSEIYEALDFYREYFGC